MFRRWFCSAGSAGAGGLSKTIENKLKNQFNASLIHVQDTSGGCGQFFSILIVSDHFKGKKLIDQHRMVKEALKEEVSNIHGLTITTKVPE